MESLYISKITINKVRHLQNIEIPLTSKEKKHLILTGRNGSGKTSLLDAMETFLNSVTSTIDPMDAMRNLETDKNTLSLLQQRLAKDPTLDRQIKAAKERIEHYKKRIDESTGGVWLDTVPEIEDIRNMFSRGEFVVAYYRADRVFAAEEPTHVEKIQLKRGYKINEKPREEWVKYLLDLKTTEALAKTNGKPERAENIGKWFVSLEKLLKKIFENDTVQLVFDVDTYKFSIQIDGLEAFDFNTMSSGYAAILDIVVDLIMRMEAQGNQKFDFQTQGIVLIDEIETHLHLELQKKILVFLTTVFPNIQFIVSTHSPFVLNSLKNVVIYDLENRTLVEHDLSNVPYSGIVEGYFGADEMSQMLKDKYERYRELAQKRELEDSDYEEIADLEMYLDEIPDFLALGISAEYKRLKQELRDREDA